MGQSQSYVITHHGQRKSMVFPWGFTAARRSWANGQGPQWSWSSLVPLPLSSPCPGKNTVENIVRIFRTDGLSTYTYIYIYYTHDGFYSNYKWIMFHMDVCTLYNQLQNYLYVIITVMWVKQSMTGNGLYHLYKIGSWLFYSHYRVWRPGQGILMAIFIPWSLNIEWMLSRLNPLACWMYSLLGVKHWDFMRVIKWWKYRARVNI